MRGVLSYAELKGSPNGGGAFWVRFTSLQIKPALKGEVDMSDSEWTEGLKKKVASLGIVNPSVSLRSTAPRSGRLLVRYKHGVPCRTPSRSDRFNGVRGVQGGLRGEIEIFPGPPAKKYKEACSAFCLFNSLRKFAYSEFPAPSKREPLVRFTPPCTISAVRQ